MKTKVLFVTHKFPPAVGGMEKQCFELYNGIKESCEVVLVKLKKNQNRVFWLATLKARVRKYLKSDPSITHVYFNDGLCGLAAAAVKKHSSAATIVTLHGLDVVFPNNWFQKQLKKNLIDNVDHIIPVSTATKQELLTRGIPEEKITVIPNGVDLDITHNRKDPAYLRELSQRTGMELKDKKVLVSIGRSVYRKGFSWFIQNVMPGLGEEYVYCMVGPKQKNLFWYNFLFAVTPRIVEKQVSLMGVGMDQNNISKLLSRPEYAKNSIQLGTLPHDEKIELLKNAHAFVMPNIKFEGDAEGFGLVALEAVLSGTPVLASNIEGITEAIKDGENGTLVQHENSRAWIEAVHALPDDAAVREKQINKAITYTRNNYSWEKMVSEYKKIFSVD